METYSDEYIEHYGELYVKANAEYRLLDRGIRFEAFLANPTFFLGGAQLVREIDELIEKHEMEVEQLPGGGMRYGAYFQSMHHHRYARSR